MYEFERSKTYNKMFENFCIWWKQSNKGSKLTPTEYIGCKYESIFVLFDDNQTCCYVEQGIPKAICNTLGEGLKLMKSVLKEKQHINEQKLYESYCRVKSLEYFEVEQEYKIISSNTILVHTKSKLQSGINRKDYIVNYNDRENSIRIYDYKVEEDLKQFKTAICDFKTAICEIPLENKN